MRPSTRLLLALAALTPLAACDDATTVELLEIDATGLVGGTTYLDVNGNGVRDGGDAALRDLMVVLSVGDGGQIVQEAQTDTTGFFVMTDVPVGSYRLSLSPGSLGDSLQASGPAADVQLARGDTVVANIGATFPALSFSDIRSAVPGQRVFTSGIALNPRVNFGDGLVHLQAEDGYLRVTNVSRTTLNTGDSIRILGRVAIDQGQPVLDNGVPFVLIPTATLPVPEELTTAEARSARGGRLDAALARIRSAEITDTATVNGFFRFTVNDGSGEVDVILRPFLQLNTAAVRPDTILRMNRVTGLLVPRLLEDGTTHWRLYPRGGTDVATEIKQADLSVTTTADTVNVVKGDTIAFTVVVRNLGPLGASGVEIVDSLPRALTLVSQSTTRGTYTPSTGLWTLDSLRVGASDTLTLVGRTTTDETGTTANQVRVRKIRNEVDPNPDNDLAQAVFNVSQRLSDLNLRVLADREEATQGEGIAFTVIVLNDGPRVARGVQVTDSVPSGLAFQQATVSSGSYDSDLFLWDVGDIEVGAADTLRLSARVNTAVLGTRVNRARITRLEDGADPDPSDNVAQIVFTLVPPAAFPVPVPTGEVRRR